MLEWAAWLQGTGLARSLRASLYAYPLVNVAHVLGIALLFGAISALDLRLLGAWRGLPVRSLARPLLPLAGLGLALAAVSGGLLFVVQAVDYVGNPLLWLKLAAIAVGVVNVVLTHRLLAWRKLDDGEPPRRLALAGGVSLLAWLTALAAGRLIAYW